MPTLLARARAIQQEYPRQFWVLFFGSLINNAGNGLVFPFFSLYLTRQLKFSMTEVGIAYAAFAVMSVISQVVGGTLADRWGRKPVMLVSLLGSAAGTLLFACTSLLDLSSPVLRWGWVAAVILVMGLTNSAFGPAASAMVADLVGGEKRQQAYGLLRVVQNLGLSIGPAVGGFIAHFSYFALFSVAAASSLVYSLILGRFAHETRPQAARPDTTAASAPAVGAGFRHVLLDWSFMAFCGLVVISQVVYAQMNTTLPVYLNRDFGVSEQWYGLLMSLNALLVVLFQFPLTRRTSQVDKSVMMALGNGFYAIGFGMFGFVSGLPLFFLAQATWTLGEMLAVPVAQALVADFAPEMMRGRYMGVYGVASAVAFGLGPLLGGMLMDGIGGRYIWYAAILLDGLVLLSFLALRVVFKRRAMS
jgi:MFS family permease